MTIRLRIARGVTLVELLVVLALLGIMAGVVGLTFHTARPMPALDAVRARIAAVRDSAIRSGRIVTVAIGDTRVTHLVTAFPDGRVIADSASGIDPLTGAHDATP